MPVRSRPRKTGLNGHGSTSAPGPRCDRLRGRVGLLGGDSALLDREARRVPGRPDVDLAGNLSERIGREEAVRVAEEAT